MGSSRCQVRSMSAQVIHDGRLLAAPVRSMSSRLKDGSGTSSLAGDTARWQC
jgi:hypothetical protein